MKIDWKKIAPFVVALVVFVGFAVIYCSPILEGKVIYAGDTNNWLGAAHQTQEYTKATGESCWWTGSMFSGMPTYQVDPHIPSHKVSQAWIRNTLHLGLEDTMGIIFGYLLGFYILLLCFGVNPWLSIVGAFATALSTYFFIIIPAGHVTKAVALGYLPALIGGIHLVFQKKYWFGIPILLIFGMTGIVMHPQMTYYVAMLAGVMTIAEVVMLGIKKEWKTIGTGIAICIACLALLIGTKICYLSINSEYIKETMRGGHSELTKQAQDKPAEGLDIKYATDWSYGKGETMTLLIPNWEGGASGYDLGKDSQLSQAMRKQGVSKRDAENFCKSAPTYRGEKMFTSGAVYVGAIVCFLFLLGLLIVPGPYKWALLFATLMSIFLSWGKNMMWLTELFFNYFPMYNKFRAVESILIVAEITMPLLGFMALQRIVNKEIEWPKLRTNLFIAGGITAGICLFAALFAGGFDMTSTYDAQWKGQVPQWLYDAILDQRTAMLKADAWRSLLFVVLGFGLIFWYAWKKTITNHQSPITNSILYAGLAALILIDMVPVDKRFFNNNNFVKPREANNYFAMQPWEEQILQDESLDYRVLNLNTNTFNDARTSYRLKSIGGYSAVKLRRYQDLIDEHISQMNWSVLNMLNTKYIITRQGVYPNPDAMGNAWFVNDVLFVPTPDDESAALKTLDLSKTAVADEKFRDVLTCEPQPSAEDKITLVEYTPNKLSYTSNCASNRVAVFSEIYYPHGWHLYVDGKEIELGRVNYVLRAAVIPAGEHTIKMEFVPDALAWDKLGYTLVILAILLSIVLLSWPLWKSIVPQSKPAQQ